MDSRRKISQVPKHSRGTRFRNFEDLSEPLRLVVEQAYGHGVGNIFLAVAQDTHYDYFQPLAPPNIPLQTKSAAQQRAAAAVRWVRECHLQRPMSICS